MSGKTVVSALTIERKVKLMFRYLLIFILLAGVTSPLFSQAQAKPKDHDPAVPSLTVEQKNELLTAERDYLIAFNQASQTDVCQKPQKLFTELQTKQNSILKSSGVDLKKWQFDLNTMEFVPAPKPESKPEPKSEPKSPTPSERK